MTDLSEFLGRSIRRAKTEQSARCSSQIFHESAPALPDNPARGKTPCRWPFEPQDTSPLAWWRTLPSDAFRDAERLLLLATLEQIDVLHGDDFAAALEGDPSAAIGVAFSLIPIEEVTLKADIAMTALLRGVLERNAAPALGLAQVLGLTDLVHAYATELAASWLA